MPVCSLGEHAGFVEYAALSALGNVGEIFPVGSPSGGAALGIIFPRGVDGWRVEAALLKLLALLTSPLSQPGLHFSVGPHGRPVLPSEHKGLSQLADRVEFCVNGRLEVDVRTARMSQETCANGAGLRIILQID